MADEELEAQIRITAVDETERVMQRHRRTVEECFQRSGD